MKIKKQKQQKKKKKKKLSTADEKWSLSHAQTYYDNMRRHSFDAKFQTTFAVCFF